MGNRGFDLTGQRVLITGAADSARRENGGLHFS